MPYTTAREQCSTALGDLRTQPRATKAAFSGFLKHYDLGEALGSAGRIGPHALRVAGTEYKSRQSMQVANKQGARSELGRG